MDLPGAFLTVDALRTLVGQALAVGMVTQMVRAAVPAMSTYRLRLVCIGTAILLPLALSWGPVATYVVLVMNGVLVGMTAMKTVETIKGDKPTPPATNGGQ